MTAVTEIAEVLAAHDFRRAKGTYESQCRCGWTWEGNQAHRTHVAEAIVETLGLELEVLQSVPVFVPEFDSDGSPLMDSRMVQPIQKSHLEWVTKHRLATPWKEGDVE